MNGNRVGHAVDRHHLRAADDDQPRRLLESSEQYPDHPNRNAAHGKLPFPLHPVGGHASGPGPGPPIPDPLNAFASNAQGGSHVREFRPYESVRVGAQ